MRDISIFIAALAWSGAQFGQLADDLVGLSLEELMDVEVSLT